MTGRSLRNELACTRPAQRAARRSAKRIAGTRQRLRRLMLMTHAAQEIQLMYCFPFPTLSGWTTCSDAGAVQTSLRFGIGWVALAFADRRAAQHPSPSLYPLLRKRAN